MRRSILSALGMLAAAFVMSGVQAQDMGFKQRALDSAFETRKNLNECIGDLEEVKITAKNKTLAASIEINVKKYYRLVDSTDDLIDLIERMDEDEVTKKRRKIWVALDEGTKIVKDCQNRRKIFESLAKETK